MTKGVTEVCEHCLCANASECTQPNQEQHNLPLHQLQDSLCVLCVKCLPLRQFSIHPLLALPITFDLPKTCETSTGQMAKSYENYSVRTNDETENARQEFFCGSSRSDVTCSSKATSSKASAELSSAYANSFGRKVLELEASYMHLFSEMNETGVTTVNTADFRLQNNSMKLPNQKVYGVVSFVKVAFPELVFGTDDSSRNLLNSDSALNRDSRVQQVLQCRCNSDYTDSVVYDLDELIDKSQQPPLKELSNDDINRFGKTDPLINHLLFESRFEGGNLRRATQVGERHYELILSPDFNQKKPHFQWFYFEVSNVRANVPYVFEIINCIKSASMFSSGMQPVLFSVADYVKKNCGWIRAGSSICYYRNIYSSSVTETTITKKKNSNVAKKRKSGDVRSYYTTKFEMVFKNEGDICYIAYHYPYTYSFLLGSLNRMINSARLLSKNIIALSEHLCYSLAGHSVPLVTITGAGSACDIRKRDVVVFFARVHPGESNSSWIMHGVLEYLLGQSTEAVELREQFVFKLIPMLNPDGVVNGSHRCSLAGVDLNRVWDEPLSKLHPTIYHTKGIIEYLVSVLKKPPILVVDFHGHSRRFNVFMYGNNPEESWKASDHTIKHNQEFLFLPEVLAEKSQLFSLMDCAYGITEGKETSARVVLWRQLHLSQMYTMEASYCGFDQGTHAGNQISTWHLKQLGRDLCESVALLKVRLDTSSEKAAGRPNEITKKLKKSNRFGSERNEEACV
uniref:Cytosolic carboxypeptidase 6 n=1 Tax=Syphacia muris TaxID=451379 RepID=A0A0N5AU35_9BILA